MIRKRPNQPPVCCCGEIGRRKGLKIPRWQHHTGSIPVSSTIKQSERHAARACLSPSEGKTQYAPKSSSPMLPCPVWTPRCLRSILSFPPAGCTSICVKTKSRWMEKSFLSLHACHAAAPCVFFCRICFWISRTARYFFPQGRSCAPFMKTATSWLPTSPPDFL